MVRDEFFANDKFCSFFELEEHASDKLLNKICLVGRLTHSHFGYRDVLIQEEHNVMFSLTSQMNATSRIDSYISNSITGKSVKDGKDHKMSLGCLECWGQKSSGAEEFTYEQIWVRSFKSQAICLYFNKAHNMLLVGCDNGDIVPITVDPSKPEEYTELKEYRVHKARIMGIWMDSDNKKVYSIGEDNRLVCYDMKTKLVVAGK